MAARVLYPTAIRCPPTRRIEWRPQFTQCVGYDYVMLSIDRPRSVVTVNAQPKSPSSPRGGTVDFNDSGRFDLVDAQLRLSISPIILLSAPMKLKPNFLPAGSTFDSE